MDPNIQKQFAPIIRSWPWFLVAGGGLCAYGLILGSSTLFAGVVVNQHDTIFFWNLLNLPVSVLAVLSGYQLIRTARCLSASSGEVNHQGINGFVRSLRSAIVFGGWMSLVLFFLYFSALVRHFLFTP